MNYLLLIQHKNFNFKAYFLFSKKCKGGPLTNIFATPANFNRPLYQSQDFIRTLNIFPYYLSYLPLIQHKNFNSKEHFLFSKKCKGGYLSYLLLIQHKNFNFKAHFLFSKRCKGGTLDKNILQLLQTLTDHSTKFRTSFQL